ncbi:hypothetical protein RUND412_003617 [Rhizina undulata]
MSTENRRRPREEEENVIDVETYESPRQRRKVVHANDMQNLQSDFRSYIDFPKRSSPPDVSARSESPPIRPHESESPTQTSRKSSRGKTLAIGPLKEEQLMSTIYNGQTLRPRKTIELEDGSFIRILAIKKAIYDGGATEISIQGPKFERTRCLQGLLMLKRNEVAMVSEFETVPLPSVVRIRLLALTNANYPKYRDITADDEIHGKLLCRWRVDENTKLVGCIRRIRNDEADKGYAVDESALREEWRGQLVNAVAMKKGGGKSRRGEIDTKNNDERTIDLTIDCADEVEVLPISRLPRNFCREPQFKGFGPTTYFLEPSGEDLSRSSRIGATSTTPAAVLPLSPTQSLPRKSILSKARPALINLRSPTPPIRADDMEYTFGDAFCGGGGMASGARAAGFINAWGFDFDPNAINTYKTNFPDCEAYHASADMFVQLQPEDLLVDVAHLSPPCQPHSPAHTVAGKDDDRNEASLFCVGPLLEASRPRMVTLEQTDGLLNRPEWFRSLVKCFTDMGFSVAWKVLRGVEYGVPQSRKRLFLLAASPGEMLPRWPTPKFAVPNDPETHHGRRPTRTVCDAISSIPPNATCHNPEEKLFAIPRGPVPDWGKPLNATILAGGGQYDVHPSGERAFTVRELACLQSFPITHQFIGSDTQKKKQIGNAVPPMLAEALMREVREALKRADRERLRKREGQLGGRFQQF